MIKCTCGTVGALLLWYFKVSFSLPALSKSCEAILDYVANLEKAPDPTVTKDAFSTEIYSAYDMLFNVWLQSKESKVTVNQPGYFQSPEVNNYPFSVLVH